MFVHKYYYFCSIIVMLVLLEVKNLQVRKMVKW